LEIYCKAGPVRPGPYFPKTAFTLDWEHGVVRCPNQVETPLKLGSVVKFPAEACAAYSQRPRCTGSERGRSVKLHAEEKLLQELRV
jgi:transposase